MEIVDVCNGVKSCVWSLLWEQVTPNGMKFPAIQFFQHCKQFHSHAKMYGSLSLSLSLSLLQQPNL